MGKYMESTFSSKMRINGSHDFTFHGKFKTQLSLSCLFSGSPRNTSAKRSLNRVY